MAIIGTDGRQIVGDTTAAPFGAVVRLEISFPGTASKFLASGVMIGPNDVLTAAHVLFNPDRGGYASSILVQPARSATFLPYGSAAAISIQVPPDYVTAESDPLASAPFDYGFITLGSVPAGPHLAVVSQGTAALSGASILSAGYPVDKGGDEMYSTAGTIDLVDGVALVFSDDLDLVAGQSGSPIIRNGVVVGILTHGQGGANFALRIDPERLSDIDLWRTSNSPGAGDDLVYGGPWAEAWSGLAGNDTILGMDGGDTIHGGDGNDDINGNKGNDIVDGGPGQDFARGGQGNDLVYGGDGDDWHVNGNIGNDLVYGGAGNDNVYGGPGDDLLFGEAGDDILSGDLGNDTLVGGAGRDVFSYSPGSGSDLIVDFDPAFDIIRVPTGTVLSFQPESGGTTRIEMEGGGHILVSVPFGTIGAPDLWFV